MQTVISVVMATFNDAENLRRTLESVRAQTLPPGLSLQVVVVDGGSDDHTPSVLSDFDDVISLSIIEPDDGVYDAMNKGARVSTGQWLHFLNAGDCFSSPSSMSVWDEVIREAGPAAWVVSGAQNMRSFRGEPTPIRNLPHSWARHAFGLQPHCHQATWFRQSTFNELGGYDLEMGFAADHDLIMRFGVVCAPVEIPVVLIDYLGGGISEARGREIPKLLHRNRARRFALTRGWNAVDAGVTRLTVLVNTIRRVGGRIKVQIRRRRRGR